MKIHNVAEKIAAHLTASTEFCEHGYSVVSGVRIRDVLLNGAPLQGDEIVDLLVCDGSRVLIGIAYHLETARLFNRNMCGMPYVRIPEFDTALPLSPDDDGWLDFPSEAYLESLLKSVMLSLSCVRYRQQHKSLASYRKRAVCPQADKTGKPEGKIYTLPAMPPELVLGRKPYNTRNLYKQMAAKQLLRNDFTPTPYGNAQGLFLRYIVNPFGDVCPELLAASSAVTDIRNVLSWNPRQKENTRKISLEERLMRIQNQTVTRDSDILPAVKNLLNTPVDLLFPNRTDDLQGLLKAFKCSRSLLYGKNPTGEPVSPMPVYREVLETIHALRQEFSDDPMLDDDRNRNMRRCCETLLILLSDIFLTPRDVVHAAPRNTVFTKKKSLKERLAEIPDQSVFAIFGSSLACYYQAISRLSECEYPNWIYRSKILPILNGSGKAETDFTLRFFAAYCKVCQENNGDHDWNKTLPLMFDLIVMPMCIKYNF